MTKNNDVLDAFKFIAALSVVGIHTFPSKSILGSDLKILARFSVPFFFIVSGYFLFKKISFREKEKDKKILFNYIKRILKVYLSWLIFYIPFFIVSIMNFVKGEMDLRGKISFILSILLGYVPRIGVSWYLIALVMSVFIIYYIRSYFGEKVLLTIGIVSFLIGVFTSTYGKWYFDIEWIKQVPFYGSISFSIISTICYVIIGYFLANYVFEKPLNNLFLVLGIVIFSYVGLKEVKFAQQLGVFYDAQNYFTLPIVAVLVVILSFNLENIRIPGSDFLRKSSIIIYLAQNPIKYLLFYAASQLGIQKLTYDNFKTYVVQVFLLIVFSYIIIKLSELRQFYWLKNLS